MAENGLFPLLAQSHKMAGVPPLALLFDHAMRQHLGAEYRLAEQLLAGPQGWMIKEAVDQPDDLWVRCFVKRQPSGFIYLTYALPLPGLSGAQLLPLVPQKWRRGSRVVLSFCPPDEPMPFINTVPLPPGDRVTEAMVGWFKAVGNEVGYACRCDEILREAAAKLANKLGHDRHGVVRGNATIEGVLAAISPAYRRATGKAPAARKLVPAYLSQLTADRIGSFTDKCATVATLKVEREPRIVYE